MKRTILVSTLVLAAALAGGAAIAKGPSGPGGKGLNWDSDGKVAIADLEARQKAFLEKADANSDGYITKDEMKAFREARRAQMQAKRFPDKNGDGVVDASEWNAAAQARFAKLDKNGDGVISKDEMEKAGHRRHHRR